MAADTPPPSGSPKPAPVHVDIFADVGAQKSIGDVPAFNRVNGNNRAVFSDMAGNAKAKQAISMGAALTGVSPHKGAGDSVSWQSVSGREVAGNRSFTVPMQEDDGSTSYKEVHQQRFRSGSIIEHHLHKDNADSVDKRPGAIMHVNRGRELQVVQSDRRASIPLGAAFPT
ncbi:MAG: hypothetical protein ACJA0C_000867 [Candidatus Endobugula sp.]|jgi:hypothetical protein